MKLKQACAEFFVNSDLIFEASAPTIDLFSVFSKAFIRARFYLHQSQILQNLALIKALWQEMSATYINHHIIAEYINDSNCENARL